MNNWKYDKLSKLCFRIGDGLHGTPEYSEESDIYFINGNNLKDGKIEITDSTKKVTSEELSKNFIQLNGNTLLLSINGTIGSMAFFNNERVMLGKSAAYLNFKTSINRFYYYYFQLPGVQEHFYNVATGSTIKNLSLKSIQDFEVPVPDKNIWEGISKILSSLDAKIELNSKINEELEAMAKTLYDYWLVQFDFPNANGKPYKSSGGKMVWNDELKKKIPEGWEVKTTDDLVKDIRTGLNPRDHFKLGEGSNYYITIKNIEYGRILFDSSCDRVSDETLKRIQKRSNLEKGDILFTSIEPVGKTYLLSEQPTNWNINESVFSFKPNQEKVTPEYLFMLLSSSLFNGLCKNASTGSIHKGIRITPLKDFKVVHPNLELIKDFTKIVSPYLKLIDKNQKENQHLASLRDWLLPMLMNGQVTVGDVGNEYVVKDEVLGMVAEENNDSFSEIMNQLNLDYEIAAICLLTFNRFKYNYGKKYIHKMYSNIELLNTLPVFKELTFEEKGWGMFSSQIKKAIDNQKFILFEEINDNQKVIKLNMQHLIEVSKWTKKEENSEFVKQVNNMLTIYENPIINKKMDNIELFNTVLECMKVLETDNLQSIYTKMENWPMEEEGYTTKADKFSKIATQHMITFIKEIRN